MRFFLLILFLSLAAQCFASVAPETERVKAIDQALSVVEQANTAPVPKLPVSQTAVSVSPPGQSSVPAPNAQWEKENADKPYIGLLTEYDTVIHDDWSFEEEYHARVKIQKESAKDLGEWPVYYNKAREEILEVKAFVETPEGKKMDATNIQDLQVYNDSPMYSDMRVKVISLPQVNVGSVIDVYVKTKTTRKEVPGQYWDEITYPVMPTRVARSTYTFPADKPIQFKAYNNDHKPVIEKKDGKVMYSFIFNDTAYAEDEEFMPPMEDVAGVLSLSSMTDWSMVADWYRGLIDKNTAADEQINAKVQELVKEKTSQKDKARSILEFIQDHFRYVSMSLGDHTVEPHPTGEVFKNGYGDCKDLGLLTRQMLKLAGIDANICLFSGEFNGDPELSLPNSSVFDHVILQVDADGQKYFVDPQTKGFDLGQYPADYDNAHVLVIEPKGYHFDHLPVGAMEERSLISSSEITVLDNGSAVFDATVKLPLELSQSFKETWASSTDKNKDKFFEGLEANFTQGGRMIDRQVKGITDRYGLVEFNLKYESPNAYPLVNDMLLLKESQQANVPDFAAQERVNPLFIPSNSLIQDHNTYHIPENLKIDYVPASYDLSLDFIQVSAKYTRSENTVSVDTTTRMNRTKVPVQRYSEVKKFRNELYKKNDQYIILKKKDSLSPEAKDWVNKQ